MKNEKKFQYSKLLPIITGMVFLMCLYFSFTTDLTTIIDTSIYATAITISGGIWGSAIVWYSKKAQSENLSKLKIEMYKQSTNERLRFNKEMMELKKEYNLSDDDISEIENNNDIVEINNKDMNDIFNSLDDQITDASSINELQTF